MSNFLWLRADGFLIYINLLGMISILETTFEDDLLPSFPSLSESQNLNKVI